ncbi:MAG: division/cell wall cluster transcriptional repressor MraZ [Bacteroidia bacterium]
MSLLIGEYEVTLDAKGRFLMPSSLRKQLPEEEQSDFVLHKGLDDCLVMYPKNVWAQEVQKIQRLNMYEIKNRTFARLFLSGVSILKLDNQDRGLISKYLSEKAGLKKDLIMLAQLDRIEIWDKETYQNWLSTAETDFAALAQEVMNSITVNSHQ